MLEIIDQIIKSSMLSVILTLLLFFQWYKQHAKEQSVKNNLFSLRRMLDRTLDAENTQTVPHKAHDLIDLTDATLATLDARRPFKKRLQKILDSIRKRFYRESTKELEQLPNEEEVFVE